MVDVLQVHFQMRKEEQGHKVYENRKTETCAPLEKHVDILPWLMSGKMHDKPYTES